jgi:hypothetical protein
MGFESPGHAAMNVGECTELMVLLALFLAALPPDAPIIKINGPVGVTGPFSCNGVALLLTSLTYHPKRL